MIKKYKIFIKDKKTGKKVLMMATEIKARAKKFFEQTGWSDWIADHPIWFKRDWEIVMN